MCFVGKNLKGREKEKQMQNQSEVVSFSRKAKIKEEMPSDTNVAKYATLTLCLI